MPYIDERLPGVPVPIFLKRDFDNALIMNGIMK